MCDTHITEHGVVDGLHRVQLCLCSAAVVGRLRTLRVCVTGGGGGRSRSSSGFGSFRDSRIPSLLCCRTLQASHTCSSYISTIYILVCRLYVPNLTCKSFPCKTIFSTRPSFTCIHFAASEKLQQRHSSCPCRTTASHRTHPSLRSFSAGNGAFRCRHCLGYLYLQLLLPYCSTSVASGNASACAAKAAPCVKVLKCACLRSTSAVRCARVPNVSCGEAPHVLRGALSA
jgi:hypothetical protein